VKKIFTSYTIIFILLFFFFCNDIYTYGQKITTKEYIEKYKDIAIREMNKYNIPASITIAQGKYLCLASYSLYLFLERNELIEVPLIINYNIFCFNFLMIFSYADFFHNRYFRCVWRV